MKFSVLGKLPPSPNFNANPKPNPDPDRGGRFSSGTTFRTPKSSNSCVQHQLKLMCNLSTYFEKKYN